MINYIQILVKHLQQKLLSSENSVKANNSRITSERMCNLALKETYDLQ
jgi:hypothetical protein